MALASRSSGQLGWTAVCELLSHTARGRRPHLSRFAGRRMDMHHAIRASIKRYVRTADHSKAQTRMQHHPVEGMDWLVSGLSTVVLFADSLEPHTPHLYGLKAGPPVSGIKFWIRLASFQVLR